MPLNEQHQLSILQDILTNHQVDCCGTVSECQQIQRLIKSLLVNQQVDEQIKNTLLDVYQYSQHGQNTKNMDVHITQHKDNLSAWIDEIGNYNLT
ncbi:YtzH-like family protein [Schinkia sp. CFF1]